MLANRKFSKQTVGYTLMELVVAMGIIAVLGTLGIGAIVAARKASVEGNRVSNIKNLELALEARKNYCRDYYGYGARGGSDTKCSLTYWGNGINTDDSHLGPANEKWLAKNLGITATDAAKAYAKKATSTTYTLTACSVSTTAIDVSVMSAGTLDTEGDTGPCTGGTVLYSAARR